MDRLSAPAAIVLLDQARAAPPKLRRRPPCVGTSLKADRMIRNPVDTDRTRRLVELAGMLR
jgi:hypothetical protein